MAFELRRGFPSPFSYPISRRSRSKVLSDLGRDWVLTQTDPSVKDLSVLVAADCLMRPLDDGSLRF